MNKYMLFDFLKVILIVTCGVFLLIHYYEPKEKYEIKPLTENQIDALVQMGALPVYPNLPENTNDKDTNLEYQTVYGTCHLTQDIFGRYYCKW